MPAESVGADHSIFKNHLFTCKIYDH